MTRDVIFAALEEWIRTIDTDIEVIESDPEAPRPMPPHIVLSVISPASREGYDNQVNNDDGTITISGQRRMTVQVKYVGACAVDKLSEFRDVLDAPRVNDIFTKAGFSIPLTKPR